MASKKVKTQGKRNNVKIKSKVNSPSRVSKFLKKPKKDVKEIDNLKWLNRLTTEGTVTKGSAIPDWLNSSAYNHKMDVSCNDENLSECDNYMEHDLEDKNSTSEASECNCSNTKLTDNNNKGGILKRKISSTNSIVTYYLKSSMNQVASFIVESALRFGKKHGVVVPAKNTPDVYEIYTPDKNFEERFKKIKFRIPEKTFACEDEKKIWRNNKNSEHTSRRSQEPEPKDNRSDTSSSWESTPDSLDEILPILERLKEEGDIVTSDLDLEKLANASDAQSTENDNRHRSKDRDKSKERTKKSTKRVNSLDDLSDKNSEKHEYPLKNTKWKKIRRDSLELGRRRLKPSNCPRKQKSRSPYLY